MPPPSDAGAVVADAAEHAAEAAELAADVAAVAAAEPQPDPDTLVHAEVDLARLETEENLARIAAKTQVRIAELNQEEPAWLTRVLDCLARIEAKLEMGSSQSIPAPSAVAIVEAEPPPASVSEPAVVESIESAEAMPVQPGAENPAPAPAPQARQKSRWI